MRIYIILAALIADYHSEGARSQYSLRVEFSKEKAQIGDKLEIKCHVTNHKEEEYMVRWKKRVEGQDEVQIAVNEFVEDDFKNTKRYKAEIVEPADGSYKKVTFKMHIKDVQPEDTGRIGCLIESQRKEEVGAFKNFTVYSPPKYISMTSMDLQGKQVASYSNEQNVTFEEDTTRMFYCHVNDSYPKPVVKMMLGDTDVTKMFTQETRKSIKNGVNKLYRVSYDVSLKNESFAVTYKYSRKKLKCIAKIPRSGLPEKSIEIMIKLQEYKPKFECKHDMMVAVYRRNFQIRCPVRADPPISNLNFYWDTGDDNETLKSGETEGHYKAQVDPVNEYESIMTLKIDEVSDQHFRTYFFEAENKLGKVIHEVTLSPDPNALNVHGGGPSPVTSLLIFAVSLVLVNLL